MIKAIKGIVRNFFRHQNCLVCPVCGEKAEGSFRVLSLNVDGTVGAYALHRECEKKLEELGRQIKLKKVKTLY